MRGYYRFVYNDKIVVLFIKNKCGTKIAGDINSDIPIGLYCEDWFEPKYWEYIGCHIMYEMGI